SKGKKAPVTPKKKSLIFADGNIIPEPDGALELEKSTSQTEAEIAKEERCLHETHERLVTAKPTGVEESDESDGKPVNRPTGRRRPFGITFKDTSRVSKKKLLNQSQKLKITQVMTEEEQLSMVTEKAIKSTKADAEIDWGSKDNSHQSDEEFVNVDDIPWVSTDEEEKVDKQDDEEDDDRSIDIEETDDERIDSENGDQVMADADRKVAEKVKEENGDEEEK
nr:hypothetical protein [Tanacetum cinerariifolium]